MSEANNSNALRRPAPLAEARGAIHCERRPGDETHKSYDVGIWTICGSPDARHGPAWG